MSAAGLWYPLTDITKVPPPNLPVWLVVAVGMSATMPLMCILAAGAHRLWFSERGSCRLWFVVAAHGALTALAVFAIYGWYRDAHNATPELAVVPMGVIAVAMVTPVLWLMGRRWSKWRGTRVLAIVVYTLIAAVEVWIAALAYSGLEDVVWPVLVPESGMTPWLIASLTYVFLGLCLLGLRIAKRRVPQFPSSTTAALACLSMAMTIVTASVYVAGVEEVGRNLAFVGGWDSYQTPMGLSIPAMIAGALGPLAALLFLVRFNFSFFTTVSIGGVTIGTMALVIVLSVMSGFETDLREKILGFNAHIQISRSEQLQFEGYQEVQAVLEATPGVVGHTPYLTTEVYISNHNNYSNVLLKGVDPDRVAGVTEMVHNLEEGDERALEKIWPLNPDGSIAGKPTDAGKPSEDADGDLPIDYSGGADEVVAPEVDDEFELGELIDYSGGLDELPEELDAGMPLDGDGGLDFDALMAAENPDFIPADDWDLKVRPPDYVNPETAVLNGVLVGLELVNQINLHSNQEVRVISPLADVSPDGRSIPRIQDFRVAGKFYSGMYEYDLKYVYCSLVALQDFLEIGDQVNGIEVRVADPSKTGAIVKRLQRDLGDDYRVQDWKELNRALFSALKLEKIAMFLVLVIIILVASFSIIGNLIMVVIEKAKEIAILKTLGSSDREVMEIFIIQGFFIGLVGTLLGLLLGLSACGLGIKFGVPLDPEVYYIDKLPIQIEIGSVLAVGIAGLLISVVATIYPAYIAARMRPVKGLSWD